MKDKLASTGGALLLIGAAMMDSENLAVPFGIVGVSFVLMGIAGLIEWKEEYGGRK